VTTEFKNMFSWIRTLVGPQPAVKTPEAQTVALLDIDPVWHGDHWQNLLSSPMDARRYVMEDWTVTRPLTFDNQVADALEQSGEEMEPAY
jgi:hypothetical protein